MRMLSLKMILFQSISVPRATRLNFKRTSGATSFKSTWPRNDGLWGREWFQSSLRFRVDWQKRFKNATFGRGFFRTWRRKPSAFKQKRLHVLGALEVNNTRDASRILSIKNDIYCFSHINFLLSFTVPFRILTLFGVAVLTRWWIYTGIYLIQKRLL